MTRSTSFLLLFFVFASTSIAHSSSIFSSRLFDSDEVYTWVNDGLKSVPPGPFEAESLTGGYTTNGVSPFWEKSDVVTYQTICSYASFCFSQELSRLGIPRHRASEALLSGRIAPHVDDLQLIFDSQHPYNDREFPLQLGRRDAEFIRARSLQWNLTFGNIYKTSNRFYTVAPVMLTDMKEHSDPFFTFCVTEVSSNDLIAHSIIASAGHPHWQKYFNSDFVLGAADAAKQRSGDRAWNDFIASWWSDDFESAASYVLHGPGRDCYYGLRDVYLAWHGVPSELAPQPNLTNAQQASSSLARMHARASRRLQITAVQERLGELAGEEIADAVAGAMIRDVVPEDSLADHTLNIIDLIETISASATVYDLLFNAKCFNHDNREALNQNDSGSSYVGTEVRHAASVHINQLNGRTYKDPSLSYDMQDLSRRADGYISLTVYDPKSETRTAIGIRKRVDRYFAFIVETESIGGDALIGHVSPGDFTRYAEALGAEDIFSLYIRGKSDMPFDLARWLSESSLESWLQFK